MFDDPKKELLRIQEQLLAADNGKAAGGAQKTQKKPVAERYVNTAAPKPQKASRTKKKHKTKDKTGGLQTALILELAVLAAITIWWKIWN